MKKILIICMFLITTIVVNAQTVSKDTVKISNTERIVDKYLDKVAVFAQSLKVPAEHVYSVLTKQQTIKAISTLSACLILIGICYIIMYFALQSVKEANDEYNKDRQNQSYYYRHSVFKDSEYGVPFWFSMIVGIVVLCVLLVNFGDIFTGLFNPEYGAIQDLAHILK